MPDLIAANISTVNFILLNIALGFSIYVTLAAGLLSLAGAGFLAIGAYTGAILATRAGLPLAVGLALGVALAALVALPLGLLVLRLRTVYLAIATLGFGEIVRVLAINGDAIAGALRGQAASEVGLFNGAEGIRVTRLTATWHLALYLAVLIYVFVALRRSRFGRVLAAIRHDEAAAATLGINVVRYKTLAFTLSAMIAAGGGALNALLIRLAAPGNYDFARAVELLTYVVLGGAAHWTGAITGAIVLSVLPEVLRGLREQREIVNGIILMLAIIYLPRGIADPRFWRTAGRRLLQGRRAPRAVARSET